MKNLKLNKIWVVVPTMMIAMFSQPAQVQAGFWEGGGRGHGHSNRYEHRHHNSYSSGVIRISLFPRWPARDYVFVPAPARVIVYNDPVDTARVLVAGTTQGQAQQELFTVNIPNSQGGYTAVNIKRSGNGFVGPQGEFYAEFPKVEQLRAMYVK